MSGDAISQLGLSGRTNLQPQERGQDVHWYSNSTPKHGKFSNQSGWVTTENYVEEIFEFPPINPQSAKYGTTVVFELDKRGGSKWIEQPILRWTREAISDATDLANGACFLDYEATSTIAQVRWNYGNRLVYSMTGDQILAYYLLQEHKESRDNFKELVLGGLTMAERQALALVQKTIFLPLPVPWRKMSKAIMHEGLPNKVRIEVDFNTYQNSTRIVHGAIYHTTTGPLLSDINYQLKVVHLKQATRDQVYKMSKGPAPVVDKIVTSEWELGTQVTAGTASVKIPLRNIKNNSFVIRLFIRKILDLTDVDKSYTKFYLPWRTYVQDNGQPVTNYYYPWKLGMVYNQRIMHPLCSPITPIMEINFANLEWIEPSEDGCYGGRTFGKYNNPELVVEFNHGTTPPTWDTFGHLPNCFASGTNGAAFDVQIDAESLMHNNLIQWQGDWKRNLL